MSRCVGAVLLRTNRSVMGATVELDFVQRIRRKHLPTESLLLPSPSVLVLLILWDEFVVPVLTRRATRQFIYALVALSRSLYATIERSIHDRTHHDQYLSYFGLLFLFLRFAVWAIGLMVGYEFFNGPQYTVTAPEGSASFTTLLYFRVTNFFHSQPGRYRASNRTIPSA